MKQTIKIWTCLVTAALFTISTLAQNKTPLQQKPDPAKKVMVVDAACGECQLGLAGDDCDLAVRVNGKAYFVDGTHINSYGDAHAKDGFCKMIRKAEVQGDLVSDRFKVTYFRLLPVSTDTTKSRNR